MQTVTLEVSESFIPKLKSILEQYPTSEVHIKQDALSNEIQKRIKDIDEGREKLTPFEDGMKNLREKLEAKYANKTNS